MIDDVQEGYRKFFDEGYLRAQLAVLDAARAGGIPVFWSFWGRMAPDDGGYCTYDEFYGPYGTREFKGMNATYLATPEAAEILPELGPRTPEEKSRVIKSVHMDCFGNKDERGESRFKAMLDDWGVDTLVLTGCWTDACVIATCIRAVTEDFNVILPEDAVFSCTAAADAALEVMRNLYAQVVPAEDVAAYLRAGVAE
uniref:Isochorismatase-like domain-containing protein n=1 Tax=Zooxanthella nutricula TaxID=1333877 RepID=A0A7S2P0L6_9DINO